MSAEAQAAAVLSSIELDTTQKEQLSKVLFPDTHEATVVLLGVKRDLTPLKIKVTRKISASTTTINKIFEKISNQNSGFDQNEDLIEALYSTAKILADHYGWVDVKTAIEQEDILLTELQALVLTQVELNGTNDFFLAALRVCISAMRFSEIATVQLMSSFSGTAAVKNTDAPLMI